MLIAALGSLMKDSMIDLYRHTFIEWIHWDITIDSTMELLVEGLLQFAKIVIPIMVIALIISIAANMLQVGVLFTTEPLKFDLKKIDPIQGAKRIFSLRAIVELLKSFLKIGFIGMITFSIICIFKDEMMMLAFKNVNSAIGFFGRMTITMGIASTIALIVLAVLDYMYQKYDFEKNIRMSKQDIKDEHKNVEGDPLIKSKLKEKQREIAMRRMMAEIPKADVVITNPTHYAVAIKYDETFASAPYVIAKGTDEVALKIKDIAKNSNVMTVENKPLARSLYDEVEINEMIPEQFYQAVAEILAFVYQMEKMA